MLCDLTYHSLSLVTLVSLFSEIFHRFKFLKRRRSFGSSCETDNYLRGGRTDGISRDTVSNFSYRKKNENLKIKLKKLKRENEIVNILNGVRMSCFGSVVQIFHITFRQFLLRRKLENRVNGENVLLRIKGHISRIFQYDISNSRQH